MALDDGDAFRARRARRASAGTDCGVTHPPCDLSDYYFTMRAGLFFSFLARLEPNSSHATLWLVFQANDIVCTRIIITYLHNS